MVYKLCKIHNPCLTKQANPVGCAMWDMPFLDVNIVGLYPNQGMDAYVFSVFVLFCEVRGLWRTETQYDGSYHTPSNRIQCLQKNVHDSI